MGEIQDLLNSAVGMFFSLLELLIFVRIILSWLPIGGNNPITQLLYTLTEPILGPVRAMMDKSPLGGGMMLDFSPIIALFVMRFVQMILHGLINML